MVIHERRHVEPLVSPELERENVALPELVGLRAFEPALWLVTRLRHLAFGDEPLFVQDASHRRLRDAQTFEARQHVSQPTRSPLRVGLA